MQVTPDSYSALAARDSLRALPSLHTSPEIAPAAPAVRTFDRFPAWLRVLDTIHRAARSPVAIVAEIAVAGACAFAAGVPAPIATAMAIATAFMTYISGGYTDRGSLETQGVLWCASRTTSAVAFATLLGVSVASIADAGSGTILRFAWSAAAGLLVMRGLTWYVLAVGRRRGSGLRRTLIVGHSGQASLLARKLREYPEGGLLPVAMLPMGNGHGFARFMPEFPSAAELARSIEESGAEHVVLAPDGSDEAILECVKGSGHLDVTFSILPPLAEFFLHPGHVAQVGGIPLIPLGKIAKRRTAQPGKRLFDLIAASGLLIVLSPLMLLTALAIKLLDRGPIFYRQHRVGRGGTLFELLKFRSMMEGAERTIIDLRDRNATDGLLFKVIDDPRVTPVGRIIRRLSIDELPQLWNVVRGEMSLVGPRPLAVRPEDFGPIDGQRHSVAPGITGYWQINGGNGLSYEEMIKLDLSYIQNWSLWLDLRLVLRTFPALIHRRGPW